MSIAPQPEGSGNPPRRAISKRLRYEILRRDNYMLSILRNVHAERTAVARALMQTDTPEREN